MTGDVLLNAGNAYIMGYDVINNLRKAQAHVGYCPQFGALIPEMTGEETLFLYGRLRGIPEDLIAGNVEELIKTFVFAHEGHLKCGNYSGGTKRKLNSAIAVIGSPPVLLLDEPSWGMDAHAKRQLWDVLMKLRDRGHTMVLTSHSMEEVEALCTRMTIMVNGRLVCLGSGQHLKSKFSRGYTFIVQLASQEDHSPAPADPVKDYIMGAVDGCELFEEYQGYLHFNAPHKVGQLAELFSLLERGKETLPIADYSVQQTSLEQVFLSFTKLQAAPTLIESKCPALPFCA
ncbi:hypothetical protein EGW08_001545 [Elysia chlorotica]|uniref:Uncharacterized protein n=1 Tax=Elysia chlorotica TaxID=188477 RepID=A0A433UAB1_ELYCH|nr:hypothetical protein EGW08_001545 [Elysia chlorotica]